MRTISEYCMEVYDHSIIESIEIRMIRPSKFPVRYDDYKNSIDFTNLKTSISEHGLLQPIVVRPLEYGYEIVAGHRRFNACKSLRLRFITCKIREFSDKAAFEVQLTENIQRKSMDPIKEAESYQKYVVDFGWGGIGELAKKIGKSNEYVSHRIQLLKLPSEVKEKIVLNSINVSQGMELVGMDSDLNSQLIDDVVNNKLTVRQIRKIKNTNKSSYHDKSTDSQKDIQIIKKTTLTLKLTLNRLDELIGESQKLSPQKRVELVDFLMDLRRKTHLMIDESIKENKKLQ